MVDMEAAGETPMVADSAVVTAAEAVGTTVTITEVEVGAGPMENLAVGLTENMFPAKGIPGSKKSCLEMPKILQNNTLESILKNTTTSLSRRRALAFRSLCCSLPTHLLIPSYLKTSISLVILLQLQSKSILFLSSPLAEI